MFKRWMVFFLLITAAAFEVSGLGIQSASDPVQVREEEIVLEFLGYKGRTDTGDLPMMIKEFEGMNEGRVRVSYEYIDEANGYYDALKLRLASGEQVDLFMSDLKFIKLYADAGYVLELTGLSVDLGLTNVFSRDMLYETRRDVLYKDKLYCFPFSAAGLGLFANKQILDDAGIAFPKNWEEFLAACETLKNRDILPLIMGNKTGQGGMQFLRAAMRVEHAGQFGQVSLAVQREQNLSRMFRKSMMKLETLIQKDYFNASESVHLLDDPQVFSEFKAGKAAFMIGGTWQIASLEEGEDDFVFGPLPVNETGSSYALLFPGENLFINSGTEYPEEALRFLHFLALPENSGNWAMSQSAFPTISQVTGYTPSRRTPFTEAYGDGRILGWFPELTAMGIEDILKEGVPRFIAGETNSDDFSAFLDESLKALEEKNFPGL